MNLDIAVLSPEKAVLTYRLAGVSPRVIAHVVDIIVIIAGEFGMAYLISILISLFPILFAILISVSTLLGIFMPFLYFTLLEGFWNGQTLGKRVTEIRVTMGDGTPLTLQAAAARNLLRPADMLPIPYFSGIIVMFLNPNMQRIGDLVANSIVVSCKTPRLTFRLAPHNAGIHPLESAVGELKGMTDEHYYALRRFCDRFYEIPAEVQDRLLTDLWAPLAEKLRIRTQPSTHPIFYAEAVVMKYGRVRGLL